MWRAEIQTRSLEKDGLRAFYLAQAAIERAKIELRWNINWDPDEAIFYNLVPLGIEWGYVIDVVPVAGQPGQRDIFCRAEKEKMHP